MSETKIISSSEKIEDNGAPVVTEWRKFIYRGGCAIYWPIFAGVDKDGNIWLKFSNIRSLIALESCGALDEAVFNEFVRKLPDEMCREVHWRVPDVQYGYAIVPNGLFKVTQALIKSGQRELVKRAVRRIWDWFMYVVYPELNDLANKAKAQPEAEILPHEDLPDDEPDIDTRPLPMVKQRSFIYADKYNIRVGIDKDDEIWFALCDIFKALNRDSANAIHSSLWTSIIKKLSNKQYKMIIFREADRLEYHRILALNISGLFVVTKALLDNSTESVNTAANKLWHWVLTEVIFPMLRLKNKQCWAEEGEIAELEPELFGNPEQLPTGLEFEEVPDDEESETTKNAAHSKYKPLRCKPVKQPEQAQKHEDCRDSTASIDNTVSIWEFSEVLQFNGLKITPSMLRDYFKRCGWLDKKEHDMPTSFALNTGLFAIVRTKTIRPRAELTIKGQWYFLRLFAMLKATAFDYAYDKYLSKFGVDLEDIGERLERRSKKAIRARLKAAADIVTHFLNIIGISKGAK
ncbi:MAG: hypothetical protein IJ667_08840 [Synergistaceae bacterium]|nr:hypothetical protein [Synergistaceae bacterium]